MKVNQKTLSKKYTTVKLFLEDIEKIEQVFLEGGTATSYEIITKDFTFNNVKEFADKFTNQKITDVVFSAHSPYLQCELSGTDVSLYCASDDTNSSGRFYKLDSILRSGLRQPNFLYSFYIVYAAQIIINVPFFINFFSRESPYRILYAGLSLIVVLWIFWMTYIRLMKSGEVVLAKRSDLPHFFSRNKDLILITIIGVLLTALVPISLQWIQSKF